MGAAESLFKCLEQIPDPRSAREVRPPFPTKLRLTLLGLVCGQTTMAHIALSSGCTGGDLGLCLRASAAPHHHFAQVGESAVRTVIGRGDRLGGPSGGGAGTQ